VRKYIRGASLGVVASIEQTDATQLVLYEWSEGTKQCSSVCGLNILSLPAFMHKVHQNVTFPDERIEKFSGEGAQFRGGSLYV